MKGGSKRTYPTIHNQKAAIRHSTVQKHQRPIQGRRPTARVQAPVTNMRQRDGWSAFLWEVRPAKSFVEDVTLCPRASDCNRDSTRLDTLVATTSTAYTELNANSAGRRAKRKPVTANAARRSAKNGPAFCAVLRSTTQQEPMRPDSIHASADR